MWSPAALADSPGPLRAAGASGTLGDERLSDERTADARRLSRTGSTRSARAPARPTARSASCAGTPRTARRRTTSCCAPSAAARAAWLQIRVPRRPNGSKGWVPRRAMRQAARPDDVARDRQARAQGAAVRATAGRSGRRASASARPAPRRRAAATGSASGSPTSAATPSTARWPSAPPPTRACRTGRAAASSASTAPTRPASSPAARHTAASACPNGKIVAAGQAHAGGHAGVDPRLAASSGAPRSSPGPSRRRRTSSRARSCRRARRGR